uniref:Ig-like domain-containing protein n=1 Tax=Naja naja TaxID=35670 RepID=A0A8C6VAW2_NAJNA
LSLTLPVLLLPASLRAQSGAVLGCELREDGTQPQAQKVKEKWEDHPGQSQRKKFYLEKTCIEWLQRYLPYQKKTMQRTEPPVGKVTYKVVDDSLEVLTCQAFGFYPKEIQATWTRDGEACKYETLSKNVAPNSDGTYYIQLSIEIDPKEREHFQCYLEHEGLQEPLVLALKEETEVNITSVFENGVGSFLLHNLIISGGVFCPL